METKFILLGVYALSVLQMYFFVRIAHSKGGRWEHIPVEVCDALVVFVPVLNTACSVITVFIPPMKYSGKNKTLDKFFGVKK